MCPAAEQTALEEPQPCGVQGHGAEAQANCITVPGGFLYKGTEDRGVHRHRQARQHAADLQPEGTQGTQGTGLHRQDVPRQGTVPAGTLGLTNQGLHSAPAQAVTEVAKEC